MTLLASVFTFLTNCGNFEIFTAIRRASSLLSNLAADRRPGSSSTFSPCSFNITFKIH